MRPLIARRRAAPNARRRDPAPSRWSYRFQRLWLTPLFRVLLRKGLPAFAVILGVGWYFSDPARVTVMHDRFAEVQRSIEDRPEFRVSLMEIEGASPVLTEEIRAALGLDFPMSSFDLDLPAMRATVEEIPAIRTADLRIRPGGHLLVAVSERVPVVVWQARDGVWLLDREGARIAALSERAPDTELPMIAGDEADTAVPEALALIATASSLGERMRGLVRMGARRWDVVLNDGKRILLPAQHPARALDRVLALQDARDLLDRDVVRIDMRNPGRPSVQLTPHALAELRRMREIEMTGEQNG